MSVLVDHTQLVKMAEIIPPPELVQHPDIEGFSQEETPIHFDILVPRQGYEGQPASPALVTWDWKIPKLDKPPGTKAYIYVPYSLKFGPFEKHYILHTVVTLGKALLPPRGMGGWAGVEPEPPEKVEIFCLPLVFVVPTAPGMEIVVNVKQANRLVAERDSAGRLTAIVARDF
jgi:hypothetical protein